MAYQFGDPYVPYGEDELSQLQGLGSQLAGDITAQPGASYPAMQPPAMLGAQPEPIGAPVAPPVQPPMAPEPVMPPEPLGAPQVGFQPPPAPAPLDLPMPGAPQPPKGLMPSGFATEGMPQAERQNIMGAHQQLAQQQNAAIDAGAQAESRIQDRRVADAQGRIESSNVRANEAKMAIAGQQMARQKLAAEGAEWSKLKEEPAKAFEGIEWAGVLAAIGIGAGTFAQAVGWQRDNPVLDQFNKAVERSLAAQREQKNSRLANIRERIGDSKASEDIMRAQLHDAIADRAEAEMSRATSEDAKERLGAIVQSQRAQVQELILGAYERMVPREQQQFAPPKPAAAGKSEQDRLKDALELDKMLEERGYTPEQRQAAMHAAGMPTGGGKTAPAQAREDSQAKTSEDQAKAAAAYKSVQQLANVAGLKRNEDGSFVVEDSLGSRLNLPELGEKVSGAFGGATPIGNSREVAKEGIGRLMSGGVIGADEGEAFKKMLGEASSRRQLADVLNKIQVVVEPRLKPSDLEREKERTKPPSREQAGFRRVP